MAQGADGQCASDSSKSIPNSALTTVPNEINQMVSKIDSNQVITAPLYFSHELNRSHDSCGNGISGSQNVEELLPLPIRKNGICSKGPPHHMLSSEGSACTTESFPQGQAKDRIVGGNTFSEKSPSTSGLKGILKHRQRRKSEGNVSSVNSPSQSGPDGFGERCTPVSIPRIDFDFNNVHVECIGEPTRRESVACLGNYDVPDHSLSAARWTTGRPWAEGTTNGGCASSFDVSAAVNRNVDFQLSHDVERPVLVVKYNGYCRDDVSRTSPSVVVTVCENGSTAGDGVVKVPIRTKKGILKKRSKSTESLPKRNSIRFSDYEDEIIFHNQEDSAIQTDQTIPGSSFWNRQRKASLQESYSNRNLDTQAISDQLKSILKTSSSKGRESLPSSSEELCGILKRTSPSDSEGTPFSLSSDTAAASHLKMKGILKTQISSEDSSRYSSLEDVDCSLVEKTQSAPVESNRRFSSSSAHWAAAVNTGYTLPTLTSSTQLKGILRIDSARKSSTEMPLVPVIVSPDKNFVSEGINIIPSLLTHEPNRDCTASSLYSCVENSSSCYSRSDSCGSRPLSWSKEIKVRSILKNSNWSGNRQQPGQISHSSTLTKSSTFDPVDTTGVSTGPAKNIIPLADDANSVDGSGKQANDTERCVTSNVDIALDSCLHQSSCSSTSPLQQPVKSILRTSNSNANSNAATLFVHSSVHFTSKNSATNFSSQPTNDDSALSQESMDGAITTSQINSFTEPHSLHARIQPQVSPQFINVLSVGYNQDTSNYATHCNSSNASASANIRETDAANLRPTYNLTCFADDTVHDESVSFMASVDHDERLDEDELEY